MTRIAIVDNNKLKDMDRKLHIQKICPVNRTGTECVYFEGSKLAIDEVACIGCGICSNAEPESIQIIKLPEQLKTTPVHRYGKNKFVLYSLPTPIFGKVVGVLGKNGIGKSTAIKILAGTLKPNFGEEKEASYDELIKRFKGSETQRFFEKIKKGEIKVAYKPQSIDQIPKTYSGTVKDLLKKTNENHKFEEVVKEFELSKLLDSNIGELSGGELQRVAIAATFLKNANFYIFDEPTSYLDIKQRLNVSRLIKNLANEETAVMIIEHDLIVLDFMADLIQIMYGKQAAWGTVSQPRTTRVGINVYLDGFLKEENVRFRDKAIKFHGRPPVETSKNKKLAEWEHIEKKLGKFHLTTAPGSVNINEIAGLLGENGIGKTTFVRLIAGELAPDSGKAINKVRIAYKPQYLVPNEDLVMDFLKEAIERHKTEVIDPLNVESLFHNKLNELSGGELQKVMIAKALSQDSDFILLDEPSAHLDVEERLNVSKVIKDIIQKYDKSCLVVDHDLLFVDYLSDRIIVCDGVPAEHGKIEGPFKMEDGMNKFLAKIKITMRRDMESHRPRINKPDSQTERKQISEGKLYYVG